MKSRMTVAQANVSGVILALHMYIVYIIQCQSHVNEFTWSGSLDRLTPLLLTSTPTPDGVTWLGPSEDLPPVFASAMRV